MHFFLYASISVYCSDHLTVSSTRTIFGYKKHLDEKLFFSCVIRIDDDIFVVRSLGKYLFMLRILNLSGSPKIGSKCPVAVGKNSFFELMCINIQLCLV